ncbi:AAA family ATPase [Puniceicoccus vermicola]|uniref:MoxR family ATPase n=1 Tax=Puniceicoccus vermicola TaxID=388746 RepID=A0A7X1E831_9BACT|nr:MoxR family ATPase [Puniceicoccus vermicola]MBC2604342.1 MoxR family ATPase [Puniceicoccus vermicola]
MSQSQLSEPASETDASLNERDIELLRNAPELYHQICNELGKRIIGQRDAIRHLFIALMARGHCLMIGVPGLAKTLLVQSLADILDLDFQRIQFTPDLMPGDITGSEILEEGDDGKRYFRFAKGPLFIQLLLADEINRTPPKTQAALLEAMQEKHITVAGHTHQLQAPFFVLATQNPVEQEGTYTLPEAQLDRFMFNLTIDYPSHEEEVEILLSTTVDRNATLSKLLDADRILALQHAVRQIPVPRSVADYVVHLVQATRPDHPDSPDFIRRYLQWGAGPRASQNLALAGKVIAMLDGRFNVAKEDIIEAAPLVLRHRLLTNFHAEAEGRKVNDLIADLIRHIN